jgi:hypothetical protein
MESDDKCKARTKAATKPKKETPHLKDILQIALRFGGG